MEAFGLYREVTLDSVQEVTGQFGTDEDLSGPGRWSWGGTTCWDP
jgi:hypothetical protein